MLRARSASLFTFVVPSLRRSSDLWFELARRFSSRALLGVQDGPQNLPQAAGQLVKAMSDGALVVTRDVEFGQLILGFEQCQHYNVRDQHGDVVSLLAEDHGGLGTTIGRQLLRSRRSFKATVLSPDGTVLFKMRRPAYLMSSTMFIEDADDERIGEVQQEWRPLRRCYNLFLGNEQYARIESPFLVRGESSLHRSPYLSCDLSLFLSCDLSLYRPCPRFACQLARHGSLCCATLRGHRWRLLIATFRVLRRNCSLTPGDIAFTLGRPPPTLLNLSNGRSTQPTPTGTFRRTSCVRQ